MYDKKTPAEHLRTLIERLQAYTLVIMWWIYRITSTALTKRLRQKQRAGTSRSTSPYKRHAIITNRIEQAAINNRSRRTSSTFNCLQYDIVTTST